MQSGRFWATSIASSRERLLDFRSSWIVFIHIVWARPGGLLQFSKGQLLRSWHLFRLAFVPNSEKRRAWTIAERCGCLVVCLTSLTWQCLTLSSPLLAIDDIVSRVYSRFPDSYFPGWFFSPIGRFPAFPGWSFSRMRQFLLINLQAHT